MKFREILKSIDKNEWRTVTLVIILALFLTTLPYVIAYLNTPDNYYFRGTHSITPGDIFVYYSYINQIKGGNIILQDFFTSEPQSSGLLNLFWLPLGLTAGLLKLSPVLTFQLARVILIPIVIIGAYIFLSFFLENKRQRQLSLVLLSFASGIGAYFAEAFDKIYPSGFVDQAYNWPIDLWVSESNLFLSLLQTPHFIISWLLLLLFSALMLMAVENNKFFYSLLAGLCGFYWFNFHPYYFPYIFIIFGAYFLVLTLKNKKFFYWRHYALAFILSLPFVVYHYYQIKTDWVIGIRAGQNICLTPPFVFVSIGFGFLLICGLMGLGYLYRKKVLFESEKLLFLAIWLIVGFALIYSPFNFQRRFLMGLQVPLVVFSTIFLLAFSGYIKNKWRDNKLINYNLVFGFIVFILFGFSTLFNVSRDLYYGLYQNSVFYLPNEYKDLARWLEINNNDGKVVLSNEITGYVIPGLINQQVYLGHGHETLYYREKNKKVGAFLKDELIDDELRDFVASNNIGYFIYTPIERTFSDYQPDTKDYLSKVYQTGDYSIYAFTNY